MRPSKVKVHTTLRLPREVLMEVKRYSDRHGQKPAAVVALALKEWTLMQEYPGIDYRWTPTGRQAHISGTGLTVREMWWIWKGLNGSWRRIHYYYPHLHKRQVLAGAAYGKTHPHEVTPHPDPVGFTVVRV